MFMADVDEVTIVELNEYNLKGDFRSVLWGRYFHTQEVTLQWFINDTLIEANHTKYRLVQDGMNVMLTWPLRDSETNGLYTLKIKESDINDTMKICK